MHWDEYNVKDEFSILKQVFGVVPEPQEPTSETSPELGLGRVEFVQEDRWIEPRYAYPTSVELQAIESRISLVFSKNEPVFRIFPLPENHMSIPNNRGCNPAYLTMPVFYPPQNKDAL